MKFFKPAVVRTTLTTLLALFVLSLLGILTSAMRSKNMVDDVWQKLGLSLPAAQKNINNSFFDGRFYYTGAKNAKSLASGDRVSVVNEMVSYSKKYVNSPEFKTAWKEHQDKKSEVIRRHMPKKPEPKTRDTIKAEEKRLLDKRLTAAEANLNSPNENVKKSATIQVAGIKKEISALDDLNNPAIKRRVDMVNRQYEYQLKVYNDAIQNFEAKYPSDPKPVLKKRLQEILNMTADVDYDAELKNGENGLKIFVNPEYERKPAEWKMAFRAGKATTDAIRTAAQQWLKELN